MSKILDQVQLSNNPNIVKSVLGNPIKESDFLEYKVFWYSSRDPFVGDLLYFENDSLEIITKGVEGRILKDYLDTYGAPSLSLSYYKGDLDIGDIRDITVHIWNNQGFDIVTYGNVQESEVILERNYKPISIEEYFPGVGRQFRGNQEVSINYEFYPEELQKFSEYKIEYQNQLSTFEVVSDYARLNYILILFVTVFIITSLIGVLFFSRRRKKKRPEDIIIDNR